MSKSVLIVDDSDMVRSIVRIFLETLEGCSVVGEARDGVDAILQAQELRPDLIVIDLAMPRMNGVEAAAVIKKIIPQSKIVLFSMYGEEVGKSIKASSGIDAVVSKPEGVGKLIKYLQAFLEDPEKNKNIEQPVV
jgi:two-component system, chemotaxis family, chemotaxis protein CheY